MRVASDIDGVIADIEPELNRRISKHFSIELNEVKKDKFYMHERFDIEPKVMETFLQDEVFSDEDFWMAATPIQDNVHALRDIWLNHEVYLITGRHGHARDVTANWLELAGIPYHALLTDSLQVKHRAMKFVNAELMIEDRYAEAYTIGTKGYRSYVVERHYNLEHKGKCDVVRWVNNVHDVIEIEGL